MSNRVESSGYNGMANLAHAIRRSTALHVAMSITSPESTHQELLATADALAAWLLRGSDPEPTSDPPEPDQDEPDPVPAPNPPGSLGKPWRTVMEE